MSTRDTLLIERAIAKQRAGLGSSRRALTVETLQNMVVLLCLETAQCSLWEQSALSLVEQERGRHLRAMRTSGYEAALPGESLWLRIAEPAAHLTTPLGEVAVLFLSYQGDKAMIVEAARRLAGGQTQGVRELEAGMAEAAVEHLWVLYALDSDLTLRWSGAFRAEIDMSALHYELVDGYRCPFAPCVADHPLCQQCQECRRFFSSWLFTAYRVLLGEFRETEIAPFARLSEQSVRKVPRSDKPHKLREQQVSRQYQLVRFDASVKHLTPAREPVQPRGSWIVRDPDAVEYHERAIPKSTRVLRHPRYEQFILAHGGTLESGLAIEVRPHKKQVPHKKRASIGTPPHTVLKVTASRIEAQSQEKEGKREDTSDGAAK